MKIIAEKLAIVLDFLVFPMVGLIFGLFNLYSIYLGFQTDIDPMLKWPCLIFLIVVIPYFIYPFFRPIVNKFIVKV
jgi:hypothetical protein